MKIPTWILLIAALFVLAPLVISVTEYMDTAPEDLLGSQGFFLARNLATALVMAAALWKRDAGMLLSAFLLRLFTDIIDIINTVAGGAAFPVAFLAIVVVAAPAVWVLWSMVDGKKNLT